jgi:hypothetical protein
MEELNQDLTAGAEAVIVEAEYNAPEVAPAKLVDELLTKTLKAIEEHRKSYDFLDGNSRYLLLPLDTTIRVLTQHQPLGRGALKDKAVKQHQEAYEKKLSETKDSIVDVAIALADKADLSGYQDAQSVTNYIADKAAQGAPSETTGQRGILQDFVKIYKAYKESIDKHDPTILLQQATELFPILDKILKSKVLKTLARASEKLAAWLAFYQDYLDKSQKQGIRVQAANPQAEGAIIALTNELKAFGNAISAQLVNLEVLATEQEAKAAAENEKQQQMLAELEAKAAAAKAEADKAAAAESEPTDTEAKEEESSEPTEDAPKKRTTKK